MAVVRKRNQKAKKCGEAIHYIKQIHYVRLENPKLIVSHSIVGTHYCTKMVSKCAHERGTSICENLICVCLYRLGLKIGDALRLLSFLIEMMMTVSQMQYRRKLWHFIIKSKRGKIILINGQRKSIG